MRPFIEILVDVPPEFRLVRVGAWYHCYDFESGRGDWFYGTLTEALDWFGIELPPVGHVA